MVFKAKTKEKYEENFVLRFLFQNSKMPFFGGQPQPLLTSKNGQNKVFDGQYFFFAFSKILTKKTFVRLLFLKLNQSRNTKKNFFGGAFL